MDDSAEATTSMKPPPNAASAKFRDQVSRDLTQLFTYPNPDQSFRDFVTALLDDVLVVDAPAILLRRSKDQQIREFRAIDGGIIAKYIDEQGWTPQGKNPAYAQLWYGMPMVDLTTDQLVYRPSSPRTYKLYGYSRVEKAMQHIKLGMKRLEWQLANYESGSIPDGLMVVPPQATPEQIERQQQWMNSTLAGQIDRRVQLRLIQGFNIDNKPEQIIFPKEKLLTDELDDFLIRILCYAFSVSPHMLQKMMNRATAQTSQTSSEEEGLEPVLRFLGDLFNYVIQVKMEHGDYEFMWMEPRENDVSKQALADEVYVKNGIKTINMILEAMGEEPSDDPAADKRFIITGQGMVPIGEQVKQDIGGRNQVGAGSTAAPTRHQEQPGGAIPKALKMLITLAACDEHKDFHEFCLKCQSIQQFSKAIETDVAQTVHHHKYASTQVNLEPKFAEKIIELSKALIPDSDLDGKGRETHPHITVRYGVQDDEAALREHLSKVEPFEIMLDDTIVFPVTDASEGCAPVVVKVISAELRRLNRDLGDMTEYQSEFDYTPHTTLAYVKADAGKKYAGRVELNGVKMPVTHIALTKKDGTQVTIPLGAQKVHKAAAVVNYSDVLAYRDGPFRLDPNSFSLAATKAKRRMQDKLNGNLTKVALAVSKKVKGFKKANLGDFLDDPSFWENLWENLAEDVSPELNEAYFAGLNKGAMETNISLTGKEIDDIENAAKVWAEQRAVELVKLIPETTRKDLRKLIARAFEESIPLDALAEQIKEASTFSEDRALKIAQL
jgi:2'-5' RNA ligase